MNLERIIYCLYCPMSRVPVYVGKTKKGIDRPWEHIEQRSHNEEVNKWVNTLNKEGQQPVIIILDQADNDEILAAKEIFWIQKQLSDGYPLLNIAGIRAGFFLFKDSFEETDPLRYLRVFIRGKRRVMKLTQPELAKKAGVGIRFIRELEQGTKNNFNTESIQKVLNLFGATFYVE